MVKPKTTVLALYLKHAEKPLFGKKTSNEKASNFKLTPKSITHYQTECLRRKWRSNRHAPWNTKGRNVRSKIRWFTEFCNSHYVSHFAAFFIDARTKRSVVESFDLFKILTQTTGLITRVWFNSGGRSPGTNPQRLETERSRQSNKVVLTTKGWRSGAEHPYSLMILPQVHLRKPCYDFYFL